jgi:lysophospholipase L1-like esterase
MIKVLLLIVALMLDPQYEKSDRILFVGDSMTAYKGGWQHQFAKKLGYNYDNLSVPGKRTDWMLRTLTEHLKTRSDYKVCVIYGGINDGFAYTKTRSALENVQKMVDLCNAAGIKPIVIIGYDPNKIMVNLPRPMEKLEFHRNRYIEIQKLFLTELKNCKIVPMAQDIERKDSDDGVHFVASGHRKLAEWVYKNY